MGDDRNAVRFCEVADLDPGGNPADPRKVRLEYVDQPVSRCEGERVDGVPVLAGRKCLPRNALTDPEVTVHVLGDQVVLKPLDPVRAQGFAEPHSVFGVQRHPGVDRDLDIVADLLTRRRDQLLAAPDAVEPVLRPGAQEQLHRLEPQFQEPVDAVRGPVRDVRVAGVAEDLLLLRTAKQLVNGTPQDLALQIPQRVVDCADGEACQSSAAVRGGGSLHQVPEPLRGHAVLALDHTGEMVVDDADGRAAVQGHPKTPGPVLGRNDACRSLPVGRPVGTGQLRVSAHRANEAVTGLLRDPGLRLDLRRDVDRYGANGLDLHIALFSRVGAGRRRDSMAWRTPMHGTGRGRGKRKSGRLLFSGVNAQERDGIASWTR